MEKGVQETKYTQLSQPHPDLTRWPTNPSPLRKQTGIDRLMLVYDCVICLIPIALLIKAGLVIYAFNIDQDNSGYSIGWVSSLTLYLVRFNQEMATVFTILFIMIVSTFVKRVALYKAQKGASVAVLEQWQASISMTSTLKTVWSLEQFTLTSILLIILWSWYYLGSQASIREYSYQVSAPATTTQVTYVNPLGPSLLHDPYYTTINGSEMAWLNAQFVAFSSGPYVDQGVWQGYDLSGSFLIPDQNSSHRGMDGFYKAQNPTQSSYVSDIGVTTYYAYRSGPNATDWNWDSRVVGKINLTTNYIKVLCAPSVVRNLSDFPTGVMPSFAVSYNLSAASANTVSQKSDGSTMAPVSFVVWYRFNDSTTSIKALSSTCNITAVAVDMEAACTPSGCKAKKWKYITDPNSPYQRTLFDNSTFAARFLKEFLLSTGIPADLSDESDAETASNMWPDVVSLNTTTNGRLATDTLSELQQNARFRGTYLTSYFNDYQSVFQTGLIDKYYDPDLGGERGIDIYNGKKPVSYLSVATLKGNWMSPRYALSIPWLITDIVSCFILLAISLVSIFLNRKTLAPDIFGYVSSLTRDNPYMDLPSAGSTLTGLERAKMLKNVKVRLADSAPHSAVGKVSLVSVHDDRAYMPAAKLQKERMYL